MSNFLNTLQLKGVNVKTDLVSGPTKLLGRVTAGSGAIEEIASSAFILTLLDDVDAATARTTLGLVSGGAGDIWVKKAGDTMAGDLKFDSTLTLSDSSNAGAQDYVLMGRADAYALQAQTSGKSSVLEMYAKDGDSTDLVHMQFWGVGTPAAVTNRERMWIGWNPTGYYEIRTENAGTGVLQDLRIYGGTDTDQLVISGTKNAIGIETGDIETPATNYGSIQKGLTAYEFFGIAAGVSEWRQIDNGYYDGTFKYRTTSEASSFVLSGGDAWIDEAPSGTIDSAITWVTRQYWKQSAGIGFDTSDIEATSAQYAGINFGLRGYMLYGKASAAGTMQIGENCYYDGAWKLRTANIATLYAQQAGDHMFFIAPTGLIDSAITWDVAAIMKASGHFGVGTQTPGDNIVGTFDFTAPTFIVAQVDGARARLIARGSTDATLDLIDTGGTANEHWFAIQNDASVVTFVGVNDTATLHFTHLGLNLNNGSVGVGMSSVVANVLGVRAGASTNDAAVGGVLYVDSATHGNTTTGETDLATYTVPANTLSVNNMSLRFRAWGTVAANANAKTIRVRFGVVDVCTPVSGTSASGGSWLLEGEIVRTASNQQDVMIWPSTVGIANTPIVNIFVETVTAAIVLKITGQATATNDIKQEGFKVWWEDANT